MALTLQQPTGAFVRANDLISAVAESVELLSAEVPRALLQIQPSKPARARRRSTEDRLHSRSTTRQLRENKRHEDDQTNGARDVGSAAGDNGGCARGEE